MDFFGNNSMLTSHANNILLHSISTSAQELSYPLLDSMTSSILNSVNGPAPHLSSSLPDLVNKNKPTSLQNSPDSSVQIKYEHHTPRCKSSEDAEGVWSPDIEMAFHEALQAYPPCGRRKIILTDEGKMYGRNELIARYIKDKTGKSRTRKQVSSHIQVLARKKSKEVQQQVKDTDTRDKLLQHYSSMSSAQIVNEVLKEKKLNQSPTSVYYKPDITIKTEGKSSPGTAGGISSTSPLPFIKSEDIKFRNQVLTSGHSHYFPSQAMAFPRTPSSIADSSSSGITSHNRLHPNSTETRSPPSAQSNLRLKMLKFNGYMEGTDRSWRHSFIDLNTDTDFIDPFLEKIDIENIHDKFREFPSGDGSLRELFKSGPQSAFFLVKFWVNLNMPNRDPKSGRIFYGHDNVYESKEKLHIKVSTKACSFGKGVVEKVQRVSPIAEDGRLIYEVDKSPLCEYMINFIDKLKDLPATNLMNNVLENFTVLQHVTDIDSSDTLLCVACMFAVSETNQSQYSVYRLVGE